MKDTLVSVIVPIHNAASYLQECLNSVVSQSYRDTEIILVDDDSTDASMKIAQRYADEDERIRVYSVSEHNAALTRKKGVQNSTAEYVCFVDSDDILHVDYVRKLKELIDTQHVRVAAAKIGTFRDKPDVRVGEDDFVDSGAVKLEGDMLAYFADNYHAQGDSSTRQIPQSINAKMFKKDVLSNIDYSVLKTSVLEDNYIIPQVLRELKGEKIALLDTTLYYYRIHSQSTMAKTLDGYIQYGDREIRYPELFEITMDYVTQAFSDYPNAEARINKIRTKQYYNLTNHIYYQNKKIDGLSREIDRLNSQVSSLTEDIEGISREKRAILESKSYKVSSRMTKVARLGRNGVKKLKGSMKPLKRGNK